ncbi:MAG TPA: NUDIX hydrolase [Lichenihabitans sp.]|jgi:8-oxo-dGTP pyrophosphatase MutT (NUDIX family)|nr:NUDIX hydrolase [Lichenihabitans sp.]
MTTEPEVVEVAAVDLDYAPRPWAFAIDRAGEIAAHWQEALRRKPKMFNGRVLLMHRGAVDCEAGRSVFHGAYLETDFAAFLAWRDFGLPPAGVRNGFGMAALCAADGAYLLGEMASHTANAGRIYFASGTPDPSDIRGRKVDIEGSIRRELAEETGLDCATLDVEPGMTLVVDDTRVGFMKRIRSPEPADVLAERIDAFLARDPEAELARVHVVRRIEDIGPAVQSSCVAYLRAKLGGD